MVANKPGKIELEPRSGGIFEMRQENATATRFRKHLYTVIATKMSALMGFLLVPNRFGFYGEKPARAGIEVANKPGKIGLEPRSGDILLILDQILKHKPFIMFNFKFL